MEIKWNNINIPRKQTATLRWSAEHAAIAHEGATLRNGTELPARPWVDHTRREFDAVGTYADAYQKSENFGEAFEEMATQFGEEAQKAVEAEIWQWPRETVRQNGSVVGSPRNIIDTGELRDSYSIEIKNQ